MNFARTQPKPFRFSRLFGRASAMFALAGVGLLLYGAYVTVFPPAGGVRSLLAIFLPHLMLAWLAVSPLALRADAWLLRVVVGLVLLALGAGMVPESISRPVLASPHDSAISVLSWNLLRENQDEDTIVRTILESDADIVGLQELSLQHGRWMESSTELTARYPHRVLIPDSAYLGLAILSRSPILDHGAIAFPPVVWARIDRGSGGAINVIVAHPLPARFSLLRLGPAFIPVRFDPASRDAQIAVVRNEIDRLVSQPVPLLVIGDFNVTSRERAYRDLTRGLTDAHEAIAFGPGNSFMSNLFDELGLGVLRIDYLFAGPGVVPLSIRTDCTPRGSDHCLLTGTFGIH